MRDLIPRCWTAEQRDRPSFDEILSEFQEAEFRLLLRAKPEHCKQSVDEVLAWESESGDSMATIGLSDSKRRK
jgi:hypothetical protein